ncbi:hypothetical protein SAMN06295967_1098 [Belliella buryatensis]|uniref:Uncharacterized protein n=1 Tax=Belliella buryatensis TaxID=1500549 RepID=A0A239E740_9BACT|nr:hypothetical protein [Belliella buryatensis]SNS40476.1 hypothetical protein SAMN06295967_1098 [Belliella buryatensis]
MINKITPITTEYLTPSKSIEVLEVLNSGKTKLVFIYNYEGNHFRYFDSLIGLLQFFELGVEPKIAFETENEMIDYLKDNTYNVQSK